MSSDENNKNSNKSDTTGGDSSNNTISLPTSTTFSWKELKKSTKSTIHSSVHTIVNGTNQVLNNLYHVSENVRIPVTTALTRAESYGETIIVKSRHLYEQRYQYAPYWVLGSTIGSGILVGIRRGRIPGLIVGSMIGTITYISLYGDESAIKQAPEFSFPSLNDYQNKLHEKLPSMPSSFPGSSSSKSKDD